MEKEVLHRQSLINLDMTLSELVESRRKAASGSERAGFSDKIDEMLEVRFLMVSEIGGLAVGGAGE